MNKRKGFLYGLILTFIILVVSIIDTRWDVWFGKPAESPFLTPDTPSHILLTFGNDDNRTRYITWQCDTLLQDAFIEYTIEGNNDTLRSIATGDIVIPEGGKSAFYRAILPTSNPGKYFYRICHPYKQSDWYSFRVYDTTKEASFVFIGDIQDTINGFTPHIIQDIVERHPMMHFMVQGGDLIHRPQEIYWDEAFRSIDALRGSYPLIAVSGNHEYPKGMFQNAEQRFPFHFAYFLDLYNNNRYCFYTLQYGDAELFLLDSNSNITQLISQRKKLEKAFIESKARWKIVILHHPPYSIKNRFNNLDIKWLYTSLFDKYNIDLVLAGHEHGYARMLNRHDLQSVTPIYTISHCSPKRYEHDNTTQVITYDNNNRYYQYIEICPDSLQMKTYTTEGDIIDQITIKD